MHDLVDEVSQAGVLKVLRVMMEAEELHITQIARKAKLQYPYVQQYVELLVEVQLLRMQVYGRYKVITLEKTDPRLPPLRPLLAEWKAHPESTQGAYLRILRILLFPPELSITEIRDQTGLKHTIAKKRVEELVDSGLLRLLREFLHPRLYTVERAHALASDVESYFAAWNAYRNRRII